jgi:hypothetical protein
VRVLATVLLVIFATGAAAGAQVQRFKSAVKVTFGETGLSTSHQRPPATATPVVVSDDVRREDPIDCRMVKRAPADDPSKIRTRQPRRDVDHRMRTITPAPCAK